MNEGQHRLLAAVAVIVTLAAFRGDAWGRIPDVTVVPHSPALAYLMYPEFYRTAEDAVADTTYREDSIRDATTYWNENGARILTLVSELSGVEWREDHFPLYLVEEAPSWGSADPFILPLQYWRRGDVVRMGASGNARAFVLAHLLAQRLFAGVPADKMPPAFRHPLFEPGYGTRDNMANLVAYWTLATLTSEEKALEIVLDSGMLTESPGLKLIAENFLPGWRLTKKKPLVDWVEGEPKDSELVKKATGFRQSLGLGEVEGRRTGDVARSRIGLRTRIDRDGEVVIAAVEPGKLAEMGDLHVGDIFIRVGGVTVKNSRDVMSRMIAMLRNHESVDVELERGGELVDSHISMSWIKKKRGS